MLTNELPNIKQHLFRLVDQNKLPHAILLLGPEGSPKLEIAYQLAQYILCPKANGNGTCQSCKNCNLTQSLTHPDLHFSFPTIGTNVISNTFLNEWKQSLKSNPYLNIHQWTTILGSENKQANINKSECLNIIKKLSLKSYSGVAKIMIMWLPEFLGQEGNRLLKIIEEPQPGTHFILVAQQSHKILGTILSRMQIYKIPPASDMQIQSILFTKFDISENQISKISKIVQGNINQAIQIAQNNLDNNYEVLFIHWMRMCWKGKGDEIIHWANKVFHPLGRENQKFFFNYGLHFLKQINIIKQLGENHTRLHESELKAAKNLSQIINFEQLQALIEQFNKSHYYIERNANAKILITNASFKIHKILRKIS